MASSANPYLLDAGFYEGPDYAAARDTANENTAKRERLEAIAAEKKKRLTQPRNTSPIIDNSYEASLTGDHNNPVYNRDENGVLWQMDNKIKHDYTQEEYASLKFYMDKDRQVTQNATGGLQIGEDGKYYDAATGGFYEFGANDGGSKTGVTLGYVDGKRFDAEGRYDPEAAARAGLPAYGWKPGAQGVNVNEKRMDIKYSKADAILLEGVYHWLNRAYRTNVRAPGETQFTPEQVVDHGPGKSEYYTGVPHIQDDRPAAVRYAEGARIYQELNARPGMQDKLHAKDVYENENATKWDTDRVLGLAKLAIATPVRVAVNLADTAVELAGDVVYNTAKIFDKNATVGRDWDLATGDEQRKAIYKMYGYNSKPSDENIRFIHEKLNNLAQMDVANKGFVDKALDKLAEHTKDVPVLNLVTGGIAVLNKLGSNMTGKDMRDLLVTAIANPETAIESTGELLAMVAGSKGAGVTKLGAKIAAIRVGKLTEVAEDAAITAAKSAASTSDRLAYYLGSNSGTLAVAATITNNGLDDFEKENKRPPTMSEKLGYFAGNVALLKLDAVTELGIIKGHKTAITDAMTIVEDLPAGPKGKLVAKIGTAIAGLGYAGAKEILTEVPQEAFEATGKYNFVGEDAITGYKLDGAIKDVAVSGATGGALGFAGGVHMKAPTTLYEATGRAGKSNDEPTPEVTADTAKYMRSIDAYANDSKLSMVDATVQMLKAGEVLNNMEEGTDKVVATEYKAKVDRESGLIARIEKSILANDTELVKTLQNSPESTKNDVMHSILASKTSMTQEEAVLLAKVGNSIGVNADAAVTARYKALNAPKATPDAQEYTDEIHTSMQAHVTSAIADKSSTPATLTQLRKAVSQLYVPTNKAQQANYDSVMHTLDTKIAKDLADGTTTINDKETQTNILYSDNDTLLETQAAEAEKAAKATTDKGAAEQLIGFANEAKFRAAVLKKAKGKSFDVVEKEVTTSRSGYLTYTRNILNARVDGNKADIEKNIAKLKSLQASQHVKVDAIEAAYTAEVREISKGAPSVKPIIVTYGDNAQHTYTLHPRDVIKSIKAGEYVGGMVNVTRARNTINNIDSILEQLEAGADVDTNAMDTTVKESPAVAKMIGTTKFSKNTNEHDSVVIALHKFATGELVPYSELVSNVRRILGGDNTGKFVMPAKLYAIAHKTMRARLDAANVQNKDMKNAEVNKAYSDLVIDTNVPIADMAPVSTTEGIKNTLSPTQAAAVARITTIEIEGMDPQKVQALSTADKLLLYNMYVGTKGNVLSITDSKLVDSIRIVPTNAEQQSNIPSVQYGQVDTPVPPTYPTNESNDIVVGSGTGITNEEYGNNGQFPTGITYDGEANQPEGLGINYGDIEIPGGLDTNYDDIEISKDMGINYDDIEISKDMGINYDDIEISKDMGINYDDIGIPEDAYIQDGSTAEQVYSKVVLEVGASKMVTLMNRQIEAVEKVIDGLSTDIDLKGTVYKRAKKLQHALRKRIAHEKHKIRTVNKSLHELSVKPTDTEADMMMTVERTVKYNDRKMSQLNKIITGIALSVGTLINAVKARVTALLTDRSVAGEAVDALQAKVDKLDTIMGSLRRKQAKKRLKLQRKKAVLRNYKKALLNGTNTRKLLKNSAYAPKVTGPLGDRKYDWSATAVQRKYIPAVRDTGGNILVKARYDDNAADITKLQQSTKGKDGKYTMQSAIAGLGSSETLEETAATFQTDYNINNIVEQSGSGNLISSHGVPLEGALFDEAAIVIEDMDELLPAMEYAVISANGGKTIKNQTAIEVKGKKRTVRLEMIRMVQGMARGLIFDKNGVINPVTAAAIATAILEYLSIAQAGNSIADVAKILNKEEEQVTAKELALYAQGDNRVYVADKIGRRVLSLLGLRIQDTAKIEIASRLVTSLGLVALADMKKRKLVTETEMQLADYAEATGKDAADIEEGDEKTIGVVNIVKVNRKSLYQVSEKLTAIGKAYGEEAGVNSQVRYTKPERDANKNLMRKPTVDNQVANNTLNDKGKELEQAAWNLNTEVNDILGELGEDTVRAGMGYTTDAQLAELPAAKRESAEAKNRQIEKSIAQLSRLADENKGRAFWFKYFISTNGRFFIDNVLINPQTDKLHRFVIQLKDAMGQLVDKTKPDSAQVLEFKMGIAQAFGVSTDKLSDKTSTDIADVLLGMRKEKLVALVKEAVASGGVTLDVKGTPTKVEIEHISHAAMAIAEIGKWNSTDGKFSSNMIVEYDAITSGFILKLLQFPIIGRELVKLWLAKGGVFLDEAQKASMGELIANGDIKDAYKTNAELVETKTDILDDDTHRPLTKWTGKSSISIDTLGLFNELAVLVKPVKDAAGNITKFGRNLLKPAFMVFNYGAGLFSIASKVGVTLMEDLDVALLHSDIPTDDVEQQKVNKAMQELKGKLIAKEAYVMVKKTKVPLTMENFNAMLKAHPLEDMKIEYEATTTGRNAGLTYIKTNVADYAAEMMAVLYGRQITTIFEGTFGKLTEANKTMSTMFRFMFRLYKTAYDRKMGEITSPTTAQKKAVIEELAKIYPMVRSPFSEADNDGVAISKNSTKSNSSGMRARVELNKGVADKNSLTAQTIIREFEEAINSVAVLPIHHIDGSLMAKLLDSKLLGVHDAILAAAGNGALSAKEYNKLVVEVSTKYSMADMLVESVTSSIAGFQEMYGEAGYLEAVKAIEEENQMFVDTKSRAKLVTADGEAMSFEDAIENIKALQEEVTAGREAILGSIASVEHMAGPKGSAYIVDSKLVAHEVAVKSTATTGFQGYVGGFSSAGKGTVTGDGKDKAMRKVADGFIGESVTPFEGQSLQHMHSTSSTDTSFKEIGIKTSHNNFTSKGITRVAGVHPTVVMLARNGKLQGRKQGRKLAAYTKARIKESFENGATFVVGDMPGVDTPFIAYLNTIGATYTVYSTASTEDKVFYRSNSNNGQEYRDALKSTTSTNTGDGLVDASLQGKFDIELNKKLQGILTKLYPSIKLEYTVNDIQYRDANGNVMNQEEINSLDIVTKPGKRAGETFYEVHNKDNSIIGTASVTFRRNKVHINNIDVVESSRGSGIGSRLLVKIIQDNKNFDVTLSAFNMDNSLNTNITVAWYKTLGFILSGEGYDSTVDLPVNMIRKASPSTDVLLQQSGNKIKGQADIQAKTVLINSLLQSQDTLPHEYAHHYIAMFRESPLVKQAIKKWGSEEALVQAIGEQVVKQEGEVYDWWKKFTKWVQGKFDGLDSKSKEELRNLLTDSFLTNKEGSEFDRYDGNGNVAINGSKHGADIKALQRLQDNLAELGITGLPEVQKVVKGNIGGSTRYTRTMEDGRILEKTTVTQEYATALVDKALEVAFNSDSVKVGTAKEAIRSLNRLGRYREHVIKLVNETGNPDLADKLADALSATDDSTAHVVITYKGMEVNWTKVQAAKKFAAEMLANKDLIEFTKAQGKFDKIVGIIKNILNKLIGNMAPSLHDQIVAEVLHTMELQADILKQKEKGCN